MYMHFGLTLCVAGAQNCFHQMPRRTSVLERIAGYQLANYLRAIVDNPDSSSSQARVSPVRKHQVSQDLLARRQLALNSLGEFTGSTSTAGNGPAETHGDPGPGPQTDLDTGEFAGANLDTDGAQAGKHQDCIQPEPSAYQG
ncbi:hypothetical protein EDB89DRAFT_1913847 [Lactarius sanguifluus]|nr:hypothetical protein EDB89DRAFT_1913847 [Lactarius sanguifluus]